MAKQSRTGTLTVCDNFPRVTDGLIDLPLAHPHKIRVSTTILLVLLAMLWPLNAAHAQRKRKPRTLRKPDVIYYPTPPETVNEMLRLADIKKGDVLYDLGSGDGRIPIAAAQQFGIRA